MIMMVVDGRCIEKDGKLVCRSTGRSGVEMEIGNKPEIRRRAIKSVDVRECMGVDPHTLIIYITWLKVNDARDTNFCQMDIEGISSMCLSIYIYIYIYAYTTTLTGSTHKIKIKVKIPLQTSI